LAAGLGAPAAGLAAGAAGLLGAGELFFFCAAAKVGTAIRSRESSKPRTTMFLPWLQIIITLLSQSNFLHSFFVSKTKVFARQIRYNTQACGEE
jgi:hypothetical protein